MRLKHNRREILRRCAVAVFVTLHACAVCWWLLPFKPYITGPRSASLPEWFTQRENRLFAWKRRNAGRVVPRLLERYIFTTATFQTWHMFAPNPLEYHQWLTVYAVTGWRDPSPGAKKTLGPWGDAREPIYDPIPIYKSYEGEVTQRMKASPSRYFHDPKLVENLAVNHDRALAAFTDYWGSVYAQQKGKRPLGVHALLTRANIPTTGGATAGLPATRVIWYVHYGSK
jgi:hypothetical protein